MKAATSNTSLSSLTASISNKTSSSSSSSSTTTVPNPRNTIFVVGFPRSGVNSNDFKFFFERSIPGAKVNNAVIHKGHSRRVPGQEEREPGTPFAFVVFETEAAVPTAVNLNQKLSVLAPAGDMFANIKIERVGMKNRVKNSLYVTGFRYSDSVQAELKTFFEENLFEEGSGQEVEVDVYPVVMTANNNQMDSGDFFEHYQNNDKSYAFIFFPDHDSKQLALASLQGMTVGHHGPLDLRERSDEQKQRRKCQCQQQYRNKVNNNNNKPQPQQQQQKQTGAPFTDQQCDPFASSTTSISSSNTNNNKSKTHQQQQQQVMNKNNINKKENNKWSRTTFGSSLARMTQGCSSP